MKAKQKPALNPKLSKGKDEKGEMHDRLPDKKSDVKVLKKDMKAKLKDNTSRAKNK